MTAIEDLIRGELYQAADQGEPDMTPRQVEALTVRLARSLRPQMLGQPTGPGRPPAGRSKAAEPTRRQLEVLELFAADVTVVEVAARWGIGKSTVGDHMRSLGRRWGVPAEPCQLVNAGFERGWLLVPVPMPPVDVDVRDLTTLGLMAAGRVDEVGDVLGLSPALVARERRRLVERLGATSDAGLVAAGWRAGVLPVAPVAGVAS